MKIRFEDLNGQRTANLKHYENHILKEGNVIIYYCDLENILHTLVYDFLICLVGQNMQRLPQFLQLTIQLITASFFPLGS